MAKDIDIRVLGDKKLQKQLNKLDPKLRKKALQSAMRIAMKPVLLAAKSSAPVDSGLLRRFLRIKNLKANKKSIGVIVKYGTRKALKIDPNDPYYYPAALEYGTKTVKGRPILRNALNDNKEQVLNILAKELKPQIIKFARQK